MRFLRWALLAMLVVTATIAVFGAQGGAPAAAPPPPMVLTLPGFPDGSPIPLKYTAAGERLSPAMSWTNTPPNTVSFVLHVHDMDGALNHTTEDAIHWVMWNIPGSATGLPEGVPQGQLKDGSYQITSKVGIDQRGLGYRAPGAGATGPAHHYMFEIFALDVKLNVTPTDDASETRRNVMQAMQGHVLGKSLYMGFFHMPPGVDPKPLPK
jgi:Raf kinase inhibitor-like YbhB/YbcL family protein